jgi:hypothetical protein
MPPEPSKDEERFIAAINRFVVNQRLALLRNQKNQTPQWIELYKKYEAFNLPKEKITTFEAANKTLEDILALSQTAAFFAYQQAIQTCALEGMPDASKQMYEMPQCLEDIKKSHQKLPRNPHRKALQGLIIQAREAAKFLGFQERIKKEIRTWRDPKQTAKIDVKSAMLRALLNLQAGSPSSQTRIDGRTPSDKLLYLDTYLTLLLPNIYPEYFECTSEGVITGKGPRARAITDALGGIPLNPANFNQAALDWLYQADKKNPLWRVLKSMKPPTHDFALADKIQAYQEVSSLLANKKIGANDEAELGLKLNQTTSLLLEDAVNETPTEQVAIADNLKVMLPTLEQWTTQKKSTEPLPQAFGAFIDDAEHNRAPSPVLELHQHSTMQAESDTNRVFLNEVLTPLQAIHHRTLSAADKSTVIAILQQAERLIHINPALGPVLYDALKANKPIYQAFASDLAWLVPIKDTQSLEHSSFYSKWPAAITENEQELITLLDQERFDEERLVTDASRMRFRLTPLLENPKLPSDKRKKIEAYLMRCDALVQAYQAIPTYRPKRIELLQEGFILRHTSPKFKAFTHLKDALLQDTSLDAEFCLTSYGMDEYETLLTIQNKPHPVNLNTRFDALIADALQRKIEHLYKPILAIIEAKKAALPLAPPLSTQEEKAIVEALKRIEHAIQSIPELNIPLNLAFTRTPESPGNALKAYHSTRINEQLKKLEVQANQVPLKAYQDTITDDTFFISISNQPLSQEEVSATYPKLIQRIEKQTFSPVEKRDLIRQLIHTVRPQYAADIGIQHAASPDSLTHRLSLQNERVTENELLPILNALAVFRDKDLAPHEKANFLKLLSDARDVITQNPSLAVILREVITKRMLIESSYLLQQDKPFQEALQVHLNWLEPIPRPTPIQHSALYAYMPATMPAQEQNFIACIEKEYVAEERFVKTVSRMRLHLEPLLQDDSLPDKKRKMIEAYLKHTAKLTTAYQAMLPKPRKMQTTQELSEAYLTMRNSEAFKTYKARKANLMDAEEDHPGLHLPQSKLNLDESLINTNNAYIAWHTSDESPAFKTLTQDFVNAIIIPLKKLNQAVFSKGDIKKYLALIERAYNFAEENPSFAIILRRIITERLELERFSTHTEEKLFQEELQAHIEHFKIIEQELNPKPLTLANHTYLVWKKNTPPYPPLGKAFEECINNTHNKTLIIIGEQEAQLVIKSSPLNPEEALLQHALIFNPDDPDGHLKMQGYMRYITVHDAIKKPDNILILNHLMQRMMPLDKAISLEQKLAAYQKLIHAVAHNQLGTQNKKKRITLLVHEAIALARTQEKNTAEINLSFNTIFSTVAPLKFGTLTYQLEHFIISRSIEKPANFQSEDTIENDLISLLNDAFLDDERFIATVHLETLRLTSSQDEPNIMRHQELIRAYQAIPKLHDDINDVQALTSAYIIKYKSQEFKDYLALKKAFLKQQNQYFKRPFHGFNTKLMPIFSAAERVYREWAKENNIPPNEHLTGELKALIEHEYAQLRIEEGQKKATRIKDAFFHTIDTNERDKTLLRGALNFDLEKDEQVLELSGYINILFHTLNFTNPQTSKLYGLISSMVQAPHDTRYHVIDTLKTYHDLLEAITTNMLGREADDLIKPLIQRTLILAEKILQEAHEEHNIKSKIIVQNILIDIELSLAPNRPMYPVHRARVQAFIEQYRLTDDLTLENSQGIIKAFIQNVIEPIQSAPDDATVIAHALKKAELIIKYNPRLNIPLGIAFNRRVDNDVAHLPPQPYPTTFEMYERIIQDELCFINIGNHPLTLQEKLKSYQMLIQAIEQERFLVKEKPSPIEKRRVLIQALAQQATALVLEKELTEDEQAQLKSIQRAIPPIAFDAHLDLDRTLETHEAFLTHVITPLSVFHNKTLSKEEKAAFLNLVLHAREYIHENPELGFTLRDVLNERRQHEASYRLQDKAFQKALTQQFNWLKLIKEPAHSSFYVRLPEPTSQGEANFIDQIDAALLNQELVITHALRIKLRLTPRVDDTSLSKNKRAFIKTYLERCDRLIDAYRAIPSLPETDSIEVLGDAFRAMQASDEFESYEAVHEEIEADQTYYERLGLDTDIPNTSTNLNALQSSYAALMPEDIVESFESLIYDTSQKKAFQAGAREALRIDQEHREPKQKQKALLRHALSCTRDTPEAIAKTNGYVDTMSTLLAIETIRKNHPLQLVLKNIYATTLNSKLRSYQELIQAVANKELGEGERSELILKLVGDAMQLAQNEGENTRAVESIFEDMIPTIKALNFTKLEGLPERLEQFIQNNKVQNPTREDNEAVIQDFIQTTVTPIALILRAREKEEEPDRQLSHDEKVIIRQALWKATQLIKHHPRLALPIVFALTSGPKPIGKTLKNDRSKSIKHYLDELDACAAETTTSATCDMLLNNSASPLVPAEYNPLNLVLHALEPTQDVRFSLTDQLTLDQKLIESILKSGMKSDKKNQLVIDIINRAMSMTRYNEPIYNSKSVEKIFEAMQHVLPERPELTAFIHERAMPQPTVETNVQTTDRFIHEVINPIAFIGAQQQWVRSLSKDNEDIICEALRIARELCEHNPMLAFMIKATLDKNGSPLAKKLIGYRSKRVHQALAYFEDHLTHITEQEPGKIVQSNRWLAKHNQEQIKLREALSPETDAAQIETMKSISKFTRALEEFLSAEEIFAFKQTHAKAILAPLLHDNDLNSQEKKAIQAYIDTSDALIHLYQALGFHEALADESQSPEEVARKILKIQQSKAFDVYFFHLTKLVGQYHKLTEIQSRHNISFNSQTATFLSQSFQRLMRYNLPMLEMIKDGPHGLEGALKASKQVNLNNAMFANGYSGEFQDQAAKRPAGPLQRLIELNLNAPEGLEDSNYARLADRGAERSKRIDGYLKAMLTEAYPEQFQLDNTGYLLTNPDITEALGINHGIPGTINPEDFNAEILDRFYEADKNPLWFVLKSTKPIVANEFSFDDKLQAYQALIPLAKENKLGKPKSKDLKDKLETAIKTLERMRQDITTRYRGELSELQSMRGEDRDAQPEPKKDGTSPKKH